MARGLVDDAARGWRLATAAALSIRAAAGLFELPFQRLLTDGVTAALACAALDAALRLARALRTLAARQEVRGRR